MSNDRIQGAQITMEAPGPGMPSFRVYLDATGHGVGCCPACGAPWRLRGDASTSLGGKTFTVHCGACARGYGVRGEWRRHYRAPTTLLGKLLHHETRHVLETITITSLSVSGVGFVLRQPRPLYTGQHYAVAFALADPQRTAILEALVVTHVTRAVVGAAFFPPDTYHHDLDFYLFPAAVARPRPQTLRAPASAERGRPPQG